MSVECSLDFYTKWGSQEMEPLRHRPFKEGLRLLLSVCEQIIIQQALINSVNI